MAWNERSEDVKQLPKELPEKPNAYIYRDKFDRVHIMPESGGDWEVHPWHFYDPV
jgi:hypothetical protein